MSSLLAQVDEWRAKVEYCGEIISVYHRPKGCFLEVTVVFKARDWETNKDKARFFKGVHDELVMAANKYLRYGGYHE